MTADIRTAAQDEAERTYIPKDRIPMTSELCAKQGFIDGAVWAQARVTPTREQIMETLHDQGAYCGDCDYESRDCDWCDRVLKKYADAILALLAGLVEGVRK